MRFFRIAVLLLIAMPAYAVQRGLLEVRSRADVSRAFSPEAKLRVVNFWATWCVPCVAEMADLQAIDDSFRDDQVQIVGVSFDDAIPGARAERQKLVRKFLSKRNINFKIAYYIGKINKLADQYGFDGEIPVTMVFDRSGKELLRYQGVINRAELSSQLRKLLKSSQQSADSSQ